MSVVLGIVGWFPPEWALWLHVIKGSLAVAGVILLVWHMDTEWERMGGPQKARYLLLLGYAVLVAGASAEQIDEGTLVSYRHLASTLLSAALVWVAAYSIRSARVVRRNKG